MITLSPLDGSAVLLSEGKRTVRVFSDKGAKEGDIVLFSEPEEEPKCTCVSWPGEYDLQGVTIRGIGHNEGKQVSYLVDIDNIRFAFPSTPLVDWSEAEIEQLGDIHVLVLPATDSKKAQHLLEEVDPRALVLVPDAKGALQPDVLKMCGATGKEQVSEYKIKGSFAAEGREVVVLSK